MPRLSVQFPAFSGSYYKAVSITNISSKGVRMKRISSIVLLLLFFILSTSLFAQAENVNFINAEGTRNVKAAQDFFDNPSAYEGKTITMLVYYSYSKASLDTVVGLNVPFQSYKDITGNRFHIFIQKETPVPNATYFEVLKVTFYRGKGSDDDVNIALSISRSYLPVY
jgi:hypothetical protein